MNILAIGSHPDDIEIGCGERCMSIKIAVLGMGGMGKTHISNIEEIPEGEVVAICDLDVKNRQVAKDMGATFYCDLQEMLKHPDLDIVIVCTPTFLHYEQIKTILQAGITCISEKPLCLSSLQAKELYEIADENNVHLYVAQVLRFWNEYEKLTKLVKEKRYGEVLDVHFCRFIQRPNWITGGWIFDKEKSGLLPYDLHIHDLDMMVSLFGRPNGFSIHSGGRDEGEEKEYYRINYDYEGPTVCVEFGWFDVPLPFTQNFRVYFEDALVIFDGETMIAYERGKESPYLFKNSDDELNINSSINTPPSTAYLKELQHFLICFKNKIPSEIITKKQVITVLEILESYGD